MPPHPIEDDRAYRTPLDGDEAGTLSRLPVAVRAPRHHRTIDRVTRLLEVVVYQPGVGFAELARTLDAPKSSVHGFIQGLLANGWLFEHERRFYLGPAVHALTLASGHIRAGLITQADLAALHEVVHVPIFVGVQAGDHLVYITQMGAEALAGLEARTNIRRPLLATAGGKVLLAARSHPERDAYLRRYSAEYPEEFEAFLVEFEEIRRSRIATHLRLHGRRFALAAAVSNQSEHAVASVTLVGPTTELQPRKEELSELLLAHVDAWRQRLVTPREAI
jgi:DNA-binding IclR family transcriptional regulator